MARSLTPDEARSDYIQQMGEPLGKTFYALWQDLAYLYMKWSEYVELYGKKPTRIELLNKSAPLFFRIVQDSLWEDTLLHIARLADPEKSRGKSNLSIQALPGLIGDPNTKKSVTEKVAVAIDKAKFCREWRNRHIAHRDLCLALKEGANPLPPASRAKVKEALGAIADVLNAVSHHLMNSTTAFDIQTGSDGVVSLLYVIDDGLKAKVERRNRIKSHEYRQEDLAARDL